MEAGKLTERIEIERRTGATNENDEPLPDAWERHARVWADVRFVNGIEHVVSGAVRSAVVASFRIRFRRDVDAEMRVSYLGALYDIVAVLPNRAKGYVDLSVKVGGKYV
ncbi:phage head closure protein [Burkholderia orbicola]|uniref:phage head closure protein n=1 Tax=Burkholderia orbicola TaxID=2978683 RepID=UPI00264B822E|nr:phage head closure protein [Burkholderia orbicola]MDN7584195.1 phage head closure protein [Burkholderia orbicola]